MNKLLFTLILSAAHSLNSISQIVKFEMNWDGEVSILIEDDFIMQKKIAEINCAYSTKKPNQIIRNSPEKSSKLFDRNGRLLEKQANYVIGNASVYEHELFTYENGELKRKLEKDELGFTCTYYETDSSRTLLSTYRSEHYSPNHKKAVPDSTLINSRTFLKESDFIKVLNKNGVHIKTESNSKDSTGLLRTQKVYHELTNHYFLKRFHYNEDGYLSECILENTPTPKKAHLFYNSDDLLERVEIWNQEEKTEVLELVYNSSGWLDAVIFQNPKNNHIKITKYKYIKHS